MQRMSKPNDKWVGFVMDLSSALTQASFHFQKREIQNDHGFLKWVELTEHVKSQGNVVFLIGNGASASMASHFSADLAKNAHIHTQVFSDLSLITAVSNDIGFKFVFSEPLRRRAAPGDMLVGISSSGRSPNILEAMKVANDIGMNTITLSGMSPKNPLRRRGLLNIYVPGTTYGLVETCHAAILHHWMDLISTETPPSPISR